MSMDITAGGHRYRYGAEQHAHEARKAQESAGALNRVADLRACVGDVVNALALFLVRGEPGLEFIDPGALPCEQGTIADAASRLDELGSGQIRIVHQQARG